MYFSQHEIVPKIQFYVTLSIRELFPKKKNLRMFFPIETLLSNLNVLFLLIISEKFSVRLVFEYKSKKFYQLSSKFHFQKLTTSVFHNSYKNESWYWSSNSACSR